uniref:Putative secreted protein n=1 Tax=Rhipicephalus microplus TaxID=6941 RepID=A0A6M2DEC0_RHIMP
MFCFFFFFVSSLLLSSNYSGYCFFARARERLLNETSRFLELVRLRLKKKSCMLSLLARANISSCSYSHLPTSFCPCYPL